MRKAKTVPKSVPEMLEEGADTYRQRNAEYGNNYKRAGLVLSAMFPEGLTISSPDDWNRICLVIWLVGKVSRYTNSFETGGQPDSLLDVAVYSQMLREIDEELKCKSASSTRKPRASSERKQPPSKASQA